VTLFENLILIITHADNSRGSKAFGSVCLCVALHDNSKTKDPKVFKFRIGTDLRYPTSDMILGSKGQRSRSQDHKVQKVDRMAGVSYAVSSAQPLVCFCYKTKKTNIFVCFPKLHCTAVVYL